MSSLKKFLIAVAVAAALAAGSSQLVASQVAGVLDFLIPDVSASQHDCIYLCNPSITDVGALRPPCVHSSTYRVCCCSTVA